MRRDARRPRRAGLLSAGLIVAVCLPACADAAPKKSVGGGAGGSGAYEELRVRVVRSLPHDREAFTQGLVYFEGHLYESTGNYGRSTVRKVEVETGKVLQQTALDAGLFGEGLARVGARLVQLTWREGRALLWNLTTLKAEGAHAYAGEGWGLCHDGARLVMSDGSDRLTFRDPETFASKGGVAVRLRGAPLSQLNELECVGDLVYANVWQQNRIARIDARTGEVTAMIDAAGLLTADEARGADVLNGIAYVPETGRFLITGKHWPRLFEVELVRAMAGAAAAAPP